MVDWLDFMKIRGYDATAYTEARRKNHFYTKNPDELRDCGLVYRSPNFFIVQYDLSDYVKNSILNPMSEADVRRKLMESNPQPLDIEALIVEYFNWKHGHKLDARVLADLTEYYLSAQ